MADYKISKRTDLYVGAVYDRDKGYNAYPVFGGGIQSSTGNQSAVRMGMRHRFWSGSALEEEGA
jgi:predicted porin